MNLLERTHWMLLAALKESGSITAAAAALHITQSAASQRLAEAERRLGVRLAVKQGRGLVLTEAGETIAGAAISAAPLLQAAEADAIWEGKRSESRVRVAWPHFDMPGLAALLITLSGRIDPAPSLEFVRTSSEHLTAPFAQGMADFVCLPGDMHLPYLENIALFEDHLVAVVCPDSSLAQRSSITPEDFEGQRFLTYGLRPEPGWEYDLFFERGRRFPAEMVKVESTELICKLVSLGAGITILPAFCVRQSAFAGAVSVLELDMPAIRFLWRAWFTGTEGDETQATRLAQQLATHLG